MNSENMLSKSWVMGGSSKLQASRITHTGILSNPSLCIGKWKRTVIRHWYILDYLASFLDLASS